MLLAKEKLEVYCSDRKLGFEKISMVYCLIIPL